MIRVGVLGYGYWGQNVVRILQELPDAEVVKVCDVVTQRLALVRQQYRTIATTTDHREIIDDRAVDAVVIATPVSSHGSLALQALRLGKHVLVAGPMAANSDEAIRMIDEADVRHCVLMVDHPYVYSGAVRRIQELIASNALGHIIYYDSVRVNLGLFQHDVNVVWDLAIHDLAIMDYVLGAKPYGVAATGMSHVPGQPTNLAYLTLFFETNLIAHVNVNWLAPVKVQRTLIGGSRRMIVYDDVEPSEKVKVYDKGIQLANTPENIYKLLVSYRTGDMWAPQLDMTEALKTEAQHFIRCIEDRVPVITDGEAGLRIVNILEAANQSLADHGQLVELDSGSVRLTNPVRETPSPWRPTVPSPPPARRRTDDATLTVTLPDSISATTLSEILTAFNTLHRELAGVPLHDLAAKIGLPQEVIARAGF
jgi:predicted dehydrogenase